MNMPLETIPTEPTRSYFISVGDVESSNDQAVFLPMRPSSTEKVSHIFQHLAKEWRRDTGHLSLLSQRVRHPAYKRILQMGRSAIPLILADMQDTPDLWLHALTTLADVSDNPVPVNFDGTVEDAAALWLAWGQANNLIGS